MPLKFLDREDFIKYIIRQLGGGVIEVNLTDDQLHDAIDNAVLMFQRYHIDGSDRVIMVFDRVSGQTNYLMPDKVLAINSVMYGRYTYLGSGNRVSDDYLLYGRAPMYIRAAGIDGQVITPLFITEMYYNTLKDNLIPEPTYTYSTADHILKLHTHIDRRVIYDQTSQIFLDTEAAHMEDECTEGIFDHEFVRKYAVALAGFQWSVNLRKFVGVRGLDGSTLNSEGLFSYYSSEVARLEDSVKSSNRIPYILSM